MEQPHPKYLLQNTWIGSIVRIKE